MKIPILAAAGAVLMFSAVACHNDKSAPTQPVLVTPQPTTLPGSPTPTPPPASGATRIVSVGPGNVFQDSQGGGSATTIKAGDSVQWNFVDSIPHTSTSGNCCTPDGLWNSGLKTTGSFTHQFPTVGTFPYYCTVHGAMMTGTVTVNP
jgi:plastocyanin